MRPAATLALALALATGSAACSREIPAAERGNLVQTQSDDPKVEAARAEARRTLPQFAARWRRRSEDASNFQIKAGFPKDDGSGDEHMWVEVTDIRADGVVVGTISNEPVQTTKIAYGERVEVDPARISDWSYVSKGRIYGQYTGRALLDRMNPEARSQLKALLAPTPLESQPR